MKTKSCTTPSVPPTEALRHLPLVDLLVEYPHGVSLELALRSGMNVFAKMPEDDRTALCGPRYAHEPDRPASRAGRTPSEVVLGGRKVSIQRPRVRRLLRYLEEFKSRFSSRLQPVSLRRVGHPCQHRLHRLARAVRYLQSLLVRCTCFVPGPRLSSGSSRSVTSNLLDS